MKTIITCLTIWLLLFFPIVSFSNAENNDGLCQGQDATLQCLKENFSELYSSNYDLFWDILWGATSKAQICDSINDTAKFLEIVVPIEVNSEVGEHYSEIIEELCLKKESCFLGAMAILDTSTLEEVVWRLRDPIFTEESEIRKVFIKNKNNTEYQRLMEIYFRNQ